MEIIFYYRKKAHSKLTKKPDLDNLSPLTKQTQNKDTPRPDNVTARSSGQNTLE